MLVMTELLFFILLKVQAISHAYITFRPSSPSALLPHFPKIHKVQTNDLVHISFSPSSPPLLYPHSTELDEVQEKMHTCFAKEIKFCEQYLIRKDGVQTCIYEGYVHCWERHHGLERISSHHLLCVNSCIKHRGDIGAYAKECYESHFKKHTDLVYTQNSKRNFWLRVLNYSISLFSLHNFFFFLVTNHLTLKHKSKKDTGQTHKAKHL